MNIPKILASTCLAASFLLPLSASQTPLPLAGHAATVPDEDLKISVFILADGKGKEHFVKSGTVETVLKGAGIKLGEADQVSALRDSTVMDKQLLVVTRLSVEAVNKPVELPYETVKQDAPVTCEKDDQKVTVVTEGKKGEKVETWSEVKVEGVAQPAVKMKEEVKKKPVNEVKADCKEKPAPEPAPVAQTAPANTSSGTSSKTSSQPKTNPAPPKTTVTGTKTDWMRAAGIPESDWQYVDYIVNRESSWNPSAVNPSSGACGLAQALPCSKLGPNWNDPVTALKWQYSYVQQRYGGYAGAYSFWLKNHWY